MSTISRLILSLALFFMMIFMNACKSQQPVTNKENYIPVQPKLLFLTYNLSKTSKGDLEANLVSKIIVDGKLKEPHVENLNSQSETILCVQTNKNLISMQRMVLENPLVKIVEYVDGSGQLRKKRIELDSTQFSVRMQLHSQSKFILLKHQKTSGETKIILTKNEL